MPINCEALQSQVLGQHLHRRNRTPTFSNPFPIQIAQSVTVKTGCHLQQSWLTNFDFLQFFS